MACEGSAAPGRRRPGSRGADRGNNLYLALETRSRDPARASTRSICLRPTSTEVAEQIDADGIGLDPFEASPSVLREDRRGDRRDLLEAIVAKLPPPRGSPDEPLQALVFDAQFDPYRGVVLLCRVFDGRLKKSASKIASCTRARTTRSRRSAYLQLERKVHATDLGGGRRRLRDRRRQEHPPTSRWATPSPVIDGVPASGADSRATVEAKPMVFSVDLPRVDRRLRGPHQGAREAQAQRRRAHLRSPDSVRRPSASASAAGFLGLLHMDDRPGALEREYGLSDGADRASRCSTG